MDINQFFHPVQCLIFSIWYSTSSFHVFNSKSNCYGLNTLFAAWLESWLLIYILLHTGAHWTLQTPRFIMGLIVGNGPALGWSVQLFSLSYSIFSLFMGKPSLLVTFLNPGLTKWQFPFVNPGLTNAPVCGSAAVRRAAQVASLNVLSHFQHKTHCGFSAILKKINGKSYS